MRGKQDQNVGLQENRCCPVQRPVWKNPMGSSPGEKKGPGEKFDFQGYPLPSSTLDNPEIRQKACMDKQVSPDKLQT